MTHSSPPVMPVRRTDDTALRHFTITSRSMSKLMRLRVAVLQLNPQIGQVAANIERANKLLSNFSRPVDLLVLPEFAFTGYNFKSPQELHPYLEGTSSGVSTNWARDISKRLKCHTLVGYPEISDSKSVYNSVALTNPLGDVVHNFRKSFLYMIDETFGAEENPKGFECVKLPMLNDIKLQVGICMDINPYKFEAPSDAYEFANSARENKASIVAVAMCWTHSKSPNLMPEFARAEMKQLLEDRLDPSSTDLDSVNYWLQRSMPWLKDNKTKRTLFIAGDRCGWEDDVLYAGSSTMVTFKPSESEELADHLDYHGSLPQLEEGILYRDDIEVEL